MTGSIKSLLNSPTLYEAFQFAVGKNRLLDVIVAELGTINSGARLLDIGCGPADILPRLPFVEYFGMDISESYIADAEKRYGKRGTFKVLPAEGLAELGEDAFDVIIAVGLIHHLSDEQVEKMFEQILRLLSPHGRVFFVDPLLMAGQNYFAKLIIQQDRGQFVRDLSGYETLCRKYFSIYESVPRHDLLYIPYSHLIQKCQR